MFKKLLVVAMLSIGFTGVAQDETTDNLGKLITGGTGTLSFSNTGFGDYYAGGGLGSTTIGGLLNAYGNKKMEGGKTWDNTLRLDYGVAKVENTNGENFTKASDVIDFKSNFGTPIKGSDVWSYSAQFNFLSQLTGTNTAWDDALNDNRGGYSQLVGILDGADQLGTTQSNFLAPADFILGLGVKYKPNDNFNAFVGPLSGKLRVVGDDNIAKSGLFGNEVRSLTDYDNTRTEAGANATANYTNTFLENDMLTVATGLQLFSNYLENPQNVDVNWNTATTLNPWKFISITYATDLAYDDDKQFTAYANGTDIGSVKKGLQFRHVLGLGLTHKFGADK